MITRNGMHYIGNDVLNVMRRGKEDLFEMSGNRGEGVFEIHLDLFFRIFALAGVDVEQAIE